MTSNADPGGERPLYGIYLIIAVQILGLIYILYDALFVAHEPRLWLLAVGGGLTVAIIVGLLLWSNVARLALVVFACVSIFLTTLGLAIVLLGTWSELPINALLLILAESLVPLAFTIWVVYYLTRTDVRDRFVETTIVGNDEPGID